VIVEGEDGVLLMEREKMACYSNNGMILEGWRDHGGVARAPHSSKMACKSNYRVTVEGWRVQRWRVSRIIFLLV
jgi:hypothetical protein